MFRKELTGVMNLIIVLIGLIVSCGFGPQHPIMFIVFAAFAVLVFIYRGKLYGIPLFAIGFLTYLFFNNFMFAHGNVLGFEMNQVVSVIFMIVNACCFLIYSIYNAYELSNQGKKRR